MARVMDIAALAMSQELRRVETVAHNIANATTPGFKRQLDGAMQAAEVATTAELDAKHAVVKPVFDYTAGRLSQTDDPLHLALDGPGFFVVRLGEQLLYTRGGSFDRDAAGHLRTPEGALLQSDGGDLILQSEAFLVHSDGTVVEDEQPIGKVSIVDFPDRSALSKTVGGLFAAADGKAGAVDDPMVRQGYLEMGNVDLGHEMVRMMDALRRFQLNQKLIQGHDDMIGNAVRRLGDLQS